MAFPTPHTVYVETFIPGAKDPFGNPVDDWQGPPAPRKVIGWAPPVSADPKVAGHDRVLVDTELFAPPGFVVGPKDRVTIKGRTYLVVGHEEDTDGNPYLWHPGMTVNLHRIEG